MKVWGDDSDVSRVVKGKGYDVFLRDHCAFVLKIIMSRKKDVVRNLPHLNLEKIKTKLK